jgi:5-(carboxyamino)imidazole ribonucleotide synthase
MDNLYPGATIGVIGSDDIARDAVITAQSLGYRVAVLAKTKTSYALSAADFKFVDSGTDQQSVDEFFALSNLVTYTGPWLSADVRDRLKMENAPQGSVLLELTDDHALSRAFLESQSMNILPYEFAASLEEVEAAGDHLGFPVVVKPIFKHRHHESTVVLRGAWDIGLVAPLIDGGTLLVQSWLEDVHEYELTAVRTAGGDFSIYPIRQTAVDEKHLRRAWTVGDINDDFYEEIEKVVKRLGNTLNYVGAYSVSFLYSDTGNLYVRDVTAGVSPTDKLYDVATNVPVMEQHLRALIGQALADIMLVSPAVLMPFSDKQVAELQRHWQIKPEWRVRYFNNAVMAPQAGYVLAASGASSKDLLLQMQVAGVWQFTM